MGEEQESPNAAAKATMALSGETFSVSVSSEHGSLSSALVQLKENCAKFLGEYLARQNVPLEVDDDHDLVGDDALSDEEEEAAGSAKKRRC